jgi:Rps23 Pro-64 3,4-dihydroxylase Tpa1-like proline 4-hydroxylase
LSRSNLTYVDTENFLDFKNNKLDEENLLLRIKNFIESFDYFEIISKQIINISINFNKTDAQLDFNVYYKGCFENNHESVDYRGDGVFRLKPYKYGGWNIYSIDMPGLSI